MKALSITLLLLISICSFSQKTRLIRVDTVKGADTVYFRTEEITSTNFLTAIQIDVYPITDNSTSDSIFGQSSINGIRYYNLEATANNVFGFPNVKTAITGDSPGMLLDIVAIPNNYYGFMVTGVAGDTNIVKTYYVTKK